MADDGNLAALTAHLLLDHLPDLVLAPESVFLRFDSPGKHCADCLSRCLLQIDDTLLSVLNLALGLFIEISQKPLPVVPAIH